MSVDLSPNARVVLEKRYLLRDAQGQVCESPEGLFRRVAWFIAEGDRAFGAGDSAIAAKAEAFYDLMTSWAFLPNSPTLMNAGKPHGQLSACFVLPIEDALESIFDTLKHAALIHQSGGGTGFSFSRLRPRGDVLKFTSGVTSGPVSFMGVYNSATEAIKQGGTRRGANMGILRVDHPDIEEFIALKRDLTRMTNFNLSVGITDAFFQAVQAEDSFSLIHPQTHCVVRTLPARQLMEQIVAAAWQTGEPGLVFLDRINADNVTPALGVIEATNPCGEVPLLPYEACNLGSIHMDRMLRQTGNGTWEVDWSRFEQTIALAVDFLDNVVVQNTYPLEAIARMVHGNRKIGLGLMGWADALIRLGLPYDSEAARTLANSVSAFMAYHSKRRSLELSQSRGAFPFWPQSRYPTGGWITRRYGEFPSESVSSADWAALDQAVSTHGLRHATTLSFAPTGTISILAGASGGIEPLYALVFERYVMDNTRLREVHPQLQAALSHHGHAADMVFAALEQGIPLKDGASIPDTLSAVFVTAHDIPPTGHLQMQAAFQRFTDNAVSKTINFPPSALPQAIEAAYFEAARLGLKGVTVYRDQSRLSQPMARMGDIPVLSDARYCPDCHQTLQLREGCFQCPTCSYAACG